MKRFLLLLVALTAVVGCNPFDDSDPEIPPSPVYRYSFAVSIKDAAGNDLVAPIGSDQWKPAGDDSQWMGEINPERYTFEIKTSNPDEWIKRTYSATMGYTPYFLMAFSKSDNCYWLYCDSFIMRRFGLQNPLIYRIASPIIFGDNTEHDISTNWEEDPEFPFVNGDVSTYVQPVQCTKALFDGKGLPVRKIKYTNAGEYYYVYVIDIVLE